MTEIADKAVEFLRDLIRFDTTNPPGNELPAAQYVADALRQEGIKPVVLESAPKRGNVVARLRGDGSAGALLLMSHLDVVPADPQEWDHPPFAAEVADGYIWGRGAVDTKQLTAMQLAILLTLKRENVPLKRDVVLAATADEELGGIHGLGWLVQNHPEWVESEYAINEGGGFGVEVWGQRFYVCQTGEKGVCWMKLTARGTPGHGSIPRGDNAVAKLSAALARLSQARLPQHRTETVERLVRSLAATRGFPMSLILPLVLHPLLEGAILQRIEGQSELVAVLRATLHNTVSPTMLQAGQKTNVIPSEATAAVDGRLVPGQQPEDLIREMRPYIGDEIEVEVVGRSYPYESEPASPLFDLFQQVLDEHDAGSKLVPYLLPGASDGRFLAEKGVKVYGFSPARQEPEWSTLELAHGRNERISLANMEFGTQVLYEVVRRFCTK
jgi:acetylornithine deacetylase/succinyl-diaminopimelate desuccinylase-like protein